MARTFLVILFVSLSANAQWVTFGVTGAVPMPHSVSYPSGNVTVNYSSPDALPNDVRVQAPNDFYQKPYAVGPTVEVKLPWSFSFATGMLYERYHRDFSEGLTVIPGAGVNFGYVASVAANAFSFPLLIRYDAGHRRIRPFVEAGVTLRHLEVFDGQGVQMDLNLRPIPTPFQYVPDKPVDVAIAAGGGVRIHAGALDLIPEIRFLHWTSQDDQPAQNQAMLAVTVAFPTRR